MTGQAHQTLILPADTAVDDQPQTLFDIVRHHARARPHEVAYRWLKHGEVEDAALTFAELDHGARAMAAELQARGFSGGRALLLHKPGLAFVIAFLGCFYAGVTAVPAAVPGRRQNLAGLRGIATDARVDVVLTERALEKEFQRLQQGAGLEDKTWLLAEDVALDGAARWQPPALSCDDLALLQYTSGSTGTPKGVAVSHGNLLHNQQMVAQAFDHSRQTIFVGWLPMHHDMGLIGNVLQPLFLGIPCVLMAPEAFAQKPIRWLRAISTYRATTSGGPNFAYELCVQRIPDELKRDLDLSSWRVAFNGAEPIRPETLERFAAAYRAQGLRPATLYPCYGMAEATLFATGGRAGEPPVIASFDAAALEEARVASAPDGSPTARRLVGCGGTWIGQEIAIVDPDTRQRCAPDRVGEIWLAGQSVAQHYENQPAASAHSFAAHLADTKEGPFLRTGDLGFVCDGELFVTGRLKDLIIVRGRNHHPQDIEDTAAASHPALRASRVAAFVVESDGAERLVVIQEVNRQALVSLARQQERADVTDAIRESIVRAHGLRAHEIILVRPGSVPMTSSGKVRRTLCREQFAAGQLDLAPPAESSAHDDATGR